MRSMKNISKTKASDDFFAKYRDVLFGLSMVLMLTFGVLLFNLRVDEGGDDSAYICRAMDLLSSGRYPNYQGPLYPMFLAVVIAIFGRSLLVLTLPSLLSMLGGQAVFYFALRQRVNARLLLTVMTLLSVNAGYLYYASQTLSEAFFVLVEYLFVAAMLKFDAAEPSDNKALTKQSLLPALTVLAAFLVRTVGIGLGVAAVVYLAVQRKWRKAIALTISMLVAISAWYGLRTAIWSANVDSGSTQLASLLQKDASSAEYGLQTFAVFAARFLGFWVQYFSNLLVRFAGFKDETYRETSIPLTLVVYALFIFGALRAWRRNKCIFFLAVCAATMLSITFVILQVLWDQLRLIMPYLSMFYVVVLYGAYQAVSVITKRHADKVVGVLAVLSLLLSFNQTVHAIDLKTLKKNFAGDVLYGYTPDWYNYLYMCQWADANLPAEAYVACRKPSMADIYASGRKFYGIYTFDTEDADELLDRLRVRGVTHVILGSMRRDPLNPGQGIINTVHRYIGFICQKYPAAFNVIYVVGEGPENQANNVVYEPAYLLEINYNYIDAMRKKELE